MDVTPEQKRLWAAEVRYLHTLRRNADVHNPTTTPIPDRRRASMNKKHKQNPTSTNPDPPIVDDNPWADWTRSPPKTLTWGEFPSAPSPPPPKTLTWGEFPSAPSPPPRLPPSDTDQAKAAAVQAHHTALQTCKTFFSVEEEYAEYSETDEDDEYASNVFNLFSGIFEGNEHLREYYKKNCEHGDFICLVCAATGVKVWRRYADCASLVQHANAIRKTKRPLAHRALVNEVCRVLRWDVTRLPSIVLVASEQKDDLHEGEINAETTNNSGLVTNIVGSPNKRAAFSENKQRSRDIGDYVEIDDDSDDDEVDWDLVSKEIAFQENKQIDDHLEVDDDDGVVDWDVVSEALAPQDANNGGRIYRDPAANNQGSLLTSLPRFD